MLLLLYSIQSHLRILSAHERSSQVIIVLYGPCFIVRHQRRHMIRIEEGQRIKDSLHLISCCFTPFYPSSSKSMIRRALNSIKGTWMACVISCAKADVVGFVRLLFLASLSLLPPHPFTTSLSFVLIFALHNPSLLALSLSINALFPFFHSLIVEFPL